MKRFPKKRVALHTLGCKANQADSTHLAGLLCEKGYEVVSLSDKAAYYILNTCTITDQADREARQLTRRAKRQNPEAKVILTGCYAQTRADEAAALDSVDFVVGNTEKENIANLLPSLESCDASRFTFHASQSSSQWISPIRKHNDVHSVGLSHYSKNTRAFVKIQDGCDKFCSFCIVPFARGKNRSVGPQEILKELHTLRAHGFEEAVLTGIHIGTYGHDQKFDLLGLLQLIDKEKPLPRIRLSSLDPEEVSHELICIVAGSDVICPHFHVAVQSGDNDILDRMRRHYHINSFYDVVDKIVTAIPKAALGTDVIVGFPGETDDQFKRTFRMLEELPLSYIHVFPFSKREGTAAARYEEQIDPAIKKERVAQILKLGRQKKQKYYESFQGQSLEVIVESRRYQNEGLLKGVTRNYIPIYFAGSDTYYRKRIPVVIDNVIDTKVHGHVS